MKYALGIKFLVSFTVGGIAVLYRLQVPSKETKSEINTLIKVPKPFLFDFLTTPSNVPTYFSWVTKFEEIDKRKNLTMEKSYRGVLNLPFLGQHDVRYYISDLEAGKWIVLKPDRVRGSYLNTEIMIMVNSISNMESQFHMKIIYHRYSALFQMIMAPFLKSITDTQLEKVARRVQLIVTAKWKRWQNLPSKKTKVGGATGSNSTKSESRVVIKDESSEAATSYWTPDELQAKQKKQKGPVPPEGIPMVPVPPEENRGEL